MYIPLNFKLSIWRYDGTTFFGNATAFARPPDTLKSGQARIANICPSQRVQKQIAEG